MVNDVFLARCDERFGPNLLILGFLFSRNQELQQDRLSLALYRTPEKCVAVTSSGMLGSKKNSGRSKDYA